ncbi:MAG: hypothetical protein AB7N76_15685 [Planctomycetota bacterium]
MAESQEQARAFVAALEGWLREQPLGELLPRERTQQALDELRADDAFWSELRPRFDRAWAAREGRLRAEQRPARQVLSPEASTRILDALESLEPDPEAVRTFLRSPAIESMLGEVLYHGITEFMRKADLLGRVVNKLPVLGPIRKKVMAVFTEELEGRLEGQIKGFLGQFSGKATERMIEHVLSKDHQQGFRAARRRLGEHLLDRPMASLIPGPETTARLRDQVWGALRKAAVEDEGRLLDEVWQDHAQDPLGDWTWKLSPAATELFAGPLARFLGGGRWRIEEQA